MLVAEGEERRGEGAELSLAEGIAQAGRSLAGGEAVGGAGPVVVAGGEVPRQVRLIEEEEEAEENEVFGGSWGGIQELVGEAQAWV